MLRIMPKLGLTLWGLAAANLSLANESAPPRCFSTAQTREQILLHKLTEPFVSMQVAARRAQGDPIGARLCRIDDDFIYEISLLRRDGHVVKFLINASTGRPHTGSRER
jgi:hypothetical protein